MTDINRANMADFIRENAKKYPYKRAIVIPTGRDKFGHAAYSSLTFKQLEEETNRFARGFEKIGIKRGTKAVVLILPGIEMYITWFALCKIGATMVMIDSGIGPKSMSACIKEAAPEAFIGITKAHIARTLLRWSTDTIKIKVTLGPKLLWGGYSFYDCRDEDSSEYPIADMKSDETAAMMFTSGSTGISKGAVYTHQILSNQVRFLQETYQFDSEKDLDLATFPLFGLFDVCLGSTAVIPDMDPTKPGKADPVKLLEALNDHGATVMFGSPALIDNLSRYGEKHNVKMPSLRMVISCGAPARNDILNRLQKMLNPGVEIFTPYGATEALPVSSIGSSMILGETAPITDAGGGTCVGMPNEHVEVRIIKITDEPIAEWSEDLVIKDGSIGEITVKGPIVTREYFKRPENTKLAKIKEGDDIWHRMGDVGRIDEQGRLWFCGRKSHRVESEKGTLFTIPCERVFNQHPKVFRTALVGVGEKWRQTPVICVELEKGINDIDPQTLFKELTEIGKKYPHTSNIDKFLIHPSFPVDIRHNAKIGREKLAAWASDKLKGRK